MGWLLLLPPPAALLLLLLLPPLLLPTSAIDDRLRRVRLQQHDNRQQTGKGQNMLTYTAS
jgi:hypothetical protein